jgi:insertion element IS1 protein InsB
LAEKKAAQLPPLSETLIAPDPDDELATVLELDELWSFVLKRVNQVWIWIALWEIRHDKWLRELLEIEVKKHVESCGTIFQTSIAKGEAIADFWKAYRIVMGARAIDRKRGKGTGETAHIERWNCTLRQRLGRFVRETFSFSKCIIMHTICLDLFLHRYNLDRAILLD